MLTNFKNLAISCVIIFSTLSFAQDLEELFPVKGEMRTQVNFWKKVYTEIESSEAFIHDDEDLSIIYKKVTLPEGRRRRVRQARKQKRHIKRLIRNIANKNYQNLTDEEQKIADIVGQKTKKELYRMGRNIRYQYGLRNRYFKGLQRSYKYLDYIKKIYADMGLPRYLVYLPHVESSFNYQAYSKVGAAGIWQFMRSTARLYKLKVGYIIDERRDPFKATKAAAKLLRDNYRLLNSWPLALTAYNHGARSMMRAVKKLKTTDINIIIQGYGGRRFGFASRNFYATFMATVEISENPQKYFPRFEIPSPVIYSELPLNQPYTIRQLSKTLGLDKSTIQEFNPSIRRIAYRSSLYLPKGFVLRVPKTDAEGIEAKIAQLKKIPNTFKQLEFERLHIVSRGESLYEIAKIYRARASDIIHFNQISNPSRIYPGMKLKIPGRGYKKKTAKVAAALPEVPKTEPKVAEIRQAKEAKPIQIDFYAEYQKGIKQVLSVVDDALKTDAEKIPAVNLAAYDLEVKKLNLNLYQITVETEETLGHYAEWAKTRTQNIRAVNGFRKGRTIRLGQKIRITLRDNRVNDFKLLRNEYHLSYQEDFYNSFKITGYKPYKIKRGDVLSNLIRKFEVPYWLLRKSQKAEQLSNNLVVGEELQIPLTENIEENTSLLPSDLEEID